MKLWYKTAILIAVPLSCQLALSGLLWLVLGPGERRDSLQIIILLGTLISATATIIAARLFIFSVTSRLKIIGENAFRLSNGTALMPLLDGDDEIAALDKQVRQLIAQPASRRAEMRSFSRKAADVICGINTQFEIISVNPACRSVWDYKQEELIGRKVYEIISESGTEETRAALNKCVNAQAPVFFENAVRCGNGRISDMLWSASWSDQDQAFCCVVHDISEAKTVERMKKEFVQMISHDLRAPLQSILNSLILVGEGLYGALNAAGQKTIVSAQTNVDRLIRLINDLLDLEKIEAGKMDLSLTPVSLSSLSEHSLASVEGLARHHGVHLESDVADQEVTVDADRIIQVIINLLSNAIKYSNRGGVVSVQSTRDGELVIVRVIDHGQGIPSNQIGGIFDRFKQVKAPDISKASSGLGLAICKAIVQEHGGRIGVESQVGKGSTFWFSLPPSISNVNRSA